MSAEDRLRMIGADYYCGTCKTIRAGYQVWLPGETLPRDGICGHRLVYRNTIPVATRYRPPWKWPRELINRHRARKAGLRKVHRLSNGE